MASLVLRPTVKGKRISPMPEDAAVQDSGDVVEKKKRGRPAKADKQPAAKPAEKRKTQDEDGDGEPAPVKRGRGRPPKAGGAAKKKAPKVAGRGRGRPPKKADAKKADADESD